MRCSVVRLLFLLALLVSISCLHAQSNRVEGTSQVTESDLQGLLEQLDLSKTRKKLVPRHDVEESEGNSEAITKPSSSSYSQTSLTAILFYIVISVLVVLILYMAFANISNEDTKEVEVPVYEEKLQDIQELDVDSALEGAIQSGDFRGAIRLQFLKVLKILNDRDYISWSQEKTNRQYLQEIKETAFYDDVRILTQVFENAWYGNYRIGKSEFDQIVLLFNAFHKYNI